MGFSSKHTVLKVVCYGQKNCLQVCVCTFQPGTLTSLCVCIFNDSGSKKLGGCSLVLVLTHSFMLAGKLCNAVACVFWGARIAQWLEGQTPD